ncbi:MAG: hypothetical protein QXG34_03395 [Candidatus Bathyarchaeia archaeon]
MTERETMRPITLRRIIEVCSLVLQSNGLDTEMVSKRLNSSLSRAKEILSEVKRMNLVDVSQNLWVANSNTAKFLEYFENEEWDGMHQFFLDNYQFYREFIQILQNHLSDEWGLSMDEVTDESVQRGLHLNRTSVEVLSDWCERLGVIQRNLYTARIYLVKRGEKDFEVFFRTLVKTYRRFSSSPWRREIFVEIPLIRESVCEELKISREDFDIMLKEIYLKNIGRIEFSGAPITTHAKRSPLSEKKIKPVGKDAVMSAKSDLKKEREGLTINRKSYYYLAIHGINL